MKWALIFFVLYTRENPPVPAIEDAILFSDEELCKKAKTDLQSELAPSGEGYQTKAICVKVDSR